MNKFFIVSTSFLFVAGFISIAWAHGSSGGGSGYRSSGYSSHQFNRPSSQRAGISHRRHHGHSNSRQHHLSHKRVSPQSLRLPRIERGVIQSQPGPLQNKSFNSPLAKHHSQGFGVSPLRKALERKGLRHFHSPHAHHHNNSDLWFLYGKDKEFRQMGLIPPLPQTSRGLK